MNYFSVERKNCHFDHFQLINEVDGTVGFNNYLNLTYDEMKSQEDLEDFVISNMEASDAMFQTEDDHTILTLIGDDDIFIWSIIMGTVDGEIYYNLVDWKKDGKNYRYES